MNKRALGIMAAMALVGCGDNERARAVCEGLINGAFKHYEEALAPCVNGLDEAGFLRRYEESLQRCEDSLDENCLKSDLTHLERFEECLNAIPRCSPIDPAAFLQATERCQQELNDVRTQCQW